MHQYLNGTIPLCFMSWPGSVINEWSKWLGPQIILTWCVNVWIQAFNKLTCKHSSRWFCCKIKRSLFTPRKQVNCHAREITDIFKLYSCFIHAEKPAQLMYKYQQLVNTRSNTNLKIEIKTAWTINIYQC